VEDGQGVRLAMRFSSREPRIRRWRNRRLELTPGFQVRAVAGETDAGAEAALTAAAALKQQADSMKSNVDDFLHTIRSAA
jgi:hypothetical protein